MAHITLDDAPGAEAPDPQDPAPAPRRRRRLLWRVLIGIGVAVVVVVLAGLAWFFFGRDQAGELAAALEQRILPKRP